MIPSHLELQNRCRSSGEKSTENPCGTCGNHGNRGAAWTGNPHQLAVSRSPLSCAVPKKHQGENRIVTWNDHGTDDIDDTDDIHDMMM